MIQDPLSLSKDFSWNESEMLERLWAQGDVPAYLVDAPQDYPVLEQNTSFKPIKKKHLQFLFHDNPYSIKFYKNSVNLQLLNAAKCLIYKF